MGAAVADGAQADRRGQHRSVRRLVVFRDGSLDSLGGGGRRPVVDELGLIAMMPLIQDPLEGCDPFRRVLEEAQEHVRLREEHGFVFVKLDVGEEAGIADVGSPRPLQGRNPIIGGQTYRLSGAGEVPRQGVQIDHGREADVAALLLLQELHHVFPNRAVVTQPATMGATALERVRHAHGVLHEYTERGEVRLQGHIGERLLGLPLGEHVEPRHQCGPPPPKTFFSQSAPRL